MGRARRLIYFPYTPPTKKQVLINQHQLKKRVLINFNIIYDGMRVKQAKRLKDLEKGNARLKKLVADVSLDNAILKEAAGRNF